MNRLTQSSVSQNPKAALGAGVAGLVLLLAAFWFLVLSPNRAESAELDTKIAASEVALKAKQDALANPAAPVKVRASDLYRLTKAMPDSTNMAAILLDVNRLAGANKLALSTVQPESPVAGASSITIPVGLGVQGRFANVSRFLRDLRQLVRVRSGHLDARGRAYAISRVSFGAPEDAAFPVVKASITLNAFMFAPPAPPVAGTPTPTPAPSADGTVAAGVTP